jgi:uncharacterized Zn finger protein
VDYYGWAPYVPVAERRRQAEKEVAKLRKKGRPIAPVTIEGRTIAASFWGKSWCTNLERYSDYESRLPRGRTYVRNGSVVDLQIADGAVTALVAGSELYSINIDIAPVKRDAWTSICRDCAGTVSSLVELLQGRIARSVMDRVCRQGDGLFPGPREIKLSCSCPDSASMCKHVAAALYGVGARLDARPELLFVLSGVDQNDLMSAGSDLALNAAAPAGGKVLEDDDMAALFGLEMAETAGSEAAVPVARAATPGRRARSPGAKTPVAKATAGRAGKGAAHPAVKVETGDAAKPRRAARTKGKAPESGRLARSSSPTNNGGANVGRRVVTAAPDGLAAGKSIGKKGMSSAQAVKADSQPRRVGKGGQGIQV